MSDTLWLWIGFNVFVLGMLALDLGVFHRHAHVVKFKEAATWSVVWILLACVFGAGLYQLHPNGPQASLEFFTGYLIEKSLSIDNIFIFVLIFSAFAVPAAYQHRVLFWGILGALVMRGFFIGVGTGQGGRLFRLGRELPGADEDREDQDRDQRRLEGELGWHGVPLKSS